MSIRRSEWPGSIAALQPKRRFSGVSQGETSSRINSTAFNCLPTENRTLFRAYILLVRSASSAFLSDSQKAYSAPINVLKLVRIIGVRSFADSSW
jgi:hypothetical protein